MTNYPVDVRLFLVTLTVGMALSFGLGVFFGPDYPLSQVSPEIVDIKKVEPVKPDPGKTTTKRHPTPHSAELGKKISLNGTADGDSEEHLPAGQHLLVDMKNLEADFLNSEPRLAHAMVETVKAGGLTLLSYHCHALIPAGISCVGVLLESHISFHTWPDEGVITLDLFTCGASPLLPVVPDIERLFGIPRINAETGEKEEVFTLWAHELRGFRTHEDRRNHMLDLQSDLASWVTSALDLHYKKEIVSVKSPYHQIDIWDTLELSDTPSHEDGLKHKLEPGDPRWFTNEVASPERHLFIDGTLQSLSLSEREFHEALVHPAMFSHPNPESVAIVGGGEGATLREVLKHSTVSSVKMVEIDEMMLDISKQYLKTMNTCGDIDGSTESCFDDPRLEVLIDDGRKHFIDNYGPNAKTAGPKFDVIVIDALDPEEQRGSADVENFYNNEAFLDALYASLNDDGVMIVQVGMAPNIHDPKADIGVYKRREAMFLMLEANPSTAAMLVYEEAHCGFNDPRAFLLVCKNASCRKNFYASADAVDYKIYERIRKTKSGQPALIHYDGSTQHSYQYPPKAWETVYCRREPTPLECEYRGIPETANLYYYGLEGEETDFSIVTKEDGSYSVVAEVDIPKGSYIMPDHMAASLLVSDDSIANLESNIEVNPDAPAVVGNFLNYVKNYGHASYATGSDINYVEIGASALMEEVENESDANVGRLNPHGAGAKPVYSPVYERHRMSFDVFLVATKDIKAKEALKKPVGLWK